MWAPGPISKFDSALFAIVRTLSQRVTREDSGSQVIRGPPASTMSPVSKWANPGPTATKRGSPAAVPVHGRPRRTCSAGGSWQSFQGVGRPKLQMTRRGGDGASGGGAAWAGLLVFHALIALFQPPAFLPSTPSTPPSLPPSSPSHPPSKPKDWVGCVSVPASPAGFDCNAQPLAPTLPAVATRSPRARNHDAQVGGGQGGGATGIVVSRTGPAHRVAVVPTSAPHLDRIPSIPQGPSRITRGLKQGLRLGLTSAGRRPCPTHCPPPLARHHISIRS